MRILMTNDDGIESPGLHALALALHEREHEVLVVAPSRDMSGVGAAIGQIRGDQRIETIPASIPGAPEVTAYSLDGPPGLAVMAGCLGGIRGPARPRRDRRQRRPEPRPRLPALGHRGRRARRPRRSASPRSRRAST